MCSNGVQTCGTATYHEGASQFQCSDGNCYSSEAACDFVGAETDVVDTTPPEVFIVGPEHVVHEYKVVYADRHGVCASSAVGEAVASAYDEAEAAKAIPFFSGAFPASYVANGNNPTAPVVTCGAYAIERGSVNPATGFPDADEDLTLNVKVKQVMSESGGESTFLVCDNSKGAECVTQQGTGTPTPGRYTYEYTVADEVDNVGKATRTIDVVTRFSTTVPAVKAGYGFTHPTVTRVSQAAAFTRLVSKSLTRNEMSESCRERVFHG